MSDYTTKNLENMVKIFKSEEFNNSNQDTVVIITAIAPIFVKILSDLVVEVKNINSNLNQIRKEVANKPSYNRR